MEKRHPTIINVKWLLIPLGIEFKEFCFLLFCVDISSSIFEYFLKSKIKFKKYLFFLKNMLRIIYDCQCCDQTSPLCGMELGRWITAFRR
jgi:hypothetical protein